MDSEISGTVLSAEPRITGTGKTVYDIAFSDGNTYATFDAKIWAKVQSVGQQPASARVSVKQKGDYTNFYLNDIAPQGQLPPPGVITTPRASQSAPSAPVAQAARAQQGGMSPEREQKIVKQSSASTAFNFVASLFQGAGPEALDEAKTLAQKLAAELYGHVMDEPKNGTADLAPVEGPVAAAEKPAEDAIPW